MNTGGEGYDLFDSDSAWCLGELDIPAGIESATAHSCCELFRIKKSMHFNMIRKRCLPTVTNL